MNGYETGSKVRKGINLFQDNIVNPLSSGLMKTPAAVVPFVWNHAVVKPVQRLSEGVASIANPDLPKPALDGRAVPSLDTIEKTGLGNSFNDTIVKPVADFTAGVMGEPKPLNLPSPLKTTPVGINGATIETAGKAGASAPALNNSAAISNGLTVDPVELPGDKTSVDGVKKWKSDKGAITYGNDNGMQPSTPSISNPRLSQEEIRQIYQEDPTIAMGMQNAAGVNQDGIRFANNGQNRAIEQNRLLQLNPIQQVVDPRQALLATVNAPVTTDIAGALIQGKQRKRATDTLNQLNEMQDQNYKNSEAKDRIEAARQENFANQYKLKLDTIDKDRNYNLEANKPITKVVNEYDKDTGAIIGQNLLMLDPKTKKWVKADIADEDVPTEQT